METTQFFVAGYLAFMVVLFVYILNLQNRISKLQAELSEIKK